MGMTVSAPVDTSLYNQPAKGEETLLGFIGSKCRNTKTGGRHRLSDRSIAATACRHAGTDRQQQPKRMELQYLFGCSVDVVRLREDMDSLLKQNIMEEGIYA